MPSTWTAAAGQSPAASTRGTAVDRLPGHAADAINILCERVGYRALYSLAELGGGLSDSGHSQLNL